ncbi:hypothetical protein FSP39_005091 [Pinctada imbricata]|uniref:Sulfotransferase domain-containing protein n=1 Tax=Pinctada imbricata TaxID=66713 RepID=A0AA88YCJ1_PINIB|nr:hypothetical protein FSP39_005091 [Pinctada imbricata]
MDSTTSPSKPRYRRQNPDHMSCLNVGRASRVITCMSSLQTNSGVADDRPKSAPVVHWSHWANTPPPACQGYCPISCKSGLLPHLLHAKAIIPPPVYQGYYPTSCMQGILPRLLHARAIPTSCMSGLLKLLLHARNITPPPACQGYCPISCKSGLLPHLMHAKAITLLLHARAIKIHSACDGFYPTSCTLGLLPNLQHAGAITPPPTGQGYYPHLLHAMAIIPTPACLCYYPTSYIPGLFPHLLHARAIIPPPTYQDYYPTSCIPWLLPRLLHTMAITPPSTCQGYYHTSCMPGILPPMEKKKASRNFVKAQCDIKFQFFLIVSLVLSIGNISYIHLTSTQRRIYVWDNEEDSGGVNRLSSDRSRKEFTNVTVRPTLTYECGQSLNNSGVEDILCMKPIKFLDNFKNPCWYQMINGKKTLSCLPYFHIFGVCKSGTTDLYSRMLKHPQIVPNNGVLQKETWFWSWRRYFKRSGDPMDFWDHRYWKYIQQNNPNSKEPIVTTPNLLYHLVPNIKLILVLREPVERLYSHYYQFEGKSPLDFHEKVKQSIKVLTACTKKYPIRACLYDPYIIEFMRVPLYASIYHVHLKNWLDVFPREQMFILRTEDYKRNEREYLLEIFRFLELNDVPEEAMRKIKSSKKVYKTMRKEKMGPMLNATKSILAKFFKPHNAQLVSLMNDSRFDWHDSYLV